MYGEDTKDNFLSSSPSLYSYTFMCKYFLSFFFFFFLFVSLGFHFVVERSSVRMGLETACLDLPYSRICSFVPQILQNYGSQRPSTIYSMLRLQRNLHPVLHNMCHYKASVNELRINTVSSFLFFLLGVVPYLFFTFLYFSTSVRKGYNAPRAAFISSEVANTAYSLCALK